MNLGQFKILLEKINSLHNSMALDGTISKIEQELMKSYVSQLYEACVSNKESAKIAEPIVNQHVVEPVKSETPPPTRKVQEATPPVQEQPVIQKPVVQEPVVQAPPVVKEEPVVQYQAPVQATNEGPTPINEVSANNKAKTLNERLAEAQNKTVTTNDKFKVEEKPKAAYKPPIIINVDHLKTGTQKIVNTPPPPPPPAPKSDPAPTQVPVTNPNPSYKASTPASTNVSQSSVNTIAEYFNLHNQRKVSELSDRLSTAPITDLTKSIGLNDKISMIRELWADDQFAFNNSLNHLNALNSFEEAKSFIMDSCVANYQWDDPKKLSRAKQFIDLLRRRYPA